MIRELGIEALFKQATGNLRSLLSREFH